MNIPTAREFEEMHKGRFSSIYEMMAAFATAHCEAQRFAIIEKVKTKTVQKGRSMGGYTKYVDKEIIDKDSIKNAYPLTNIKE